MGRKNEFFIKRKWILKRKINQIKWGRTKKIKFQISWRKNENNSKYIN